MSTTRAEVTCLNCGRFLGEVESAGSRLRLVRTGTGGIGPRVTGGKLRCGRCGGRAIVEQSTDRLYAA
ncbi:MAG: hypothetical protein U0531_09335 [Dehalococcoidia bacterium]